MGFRAGDANLYRYVGNNPTNYTDPTGLWKWKIDEVGRILAVSEPGNTVRELSDKQGYGMFEIGLLATDAGIRNFDTRLEGNKTIDISPLLPELARTALSRQQTMDFELFRSFYENNNLKPRIIPKGQTIGTSGVDLAQMTVDDEAGRRLQKAISASVLGQGNCHGFTSMMIGQEIPAPGFLRRVDPRNIGFGPLLRETRGKGPGFWAGQTAEFPGIDIQPALELPGYLAFIYPSQGLYSVLTEGRTRTENPRFNAVAIYYADDTVAHSGFVLGQDDSGAIYVLSKLNANRGIVLLTNSHPALAAYDSVEYWQK